MKIVKTSRLKSSLELCDGDVVTHKDGSGLYLVLQKDYNNDSFSMVEIQTGRVYDIICPMIKVNASIHVEDL